jgi:hypothetical protein
MRRTLMFLSNHSDSGLGSCSPLCDDYPAGDNGFTGRIECIRIDCTGEGHHHLVDPEHVLYFAMSRH